jgi:hypothetical protein
LSQRLHICHSCGLQVGRDILSAYLACFTINCCVRKGSKDIISSSLDLASARSAASGHQTLSPPGSHPVRTPLENPKRDHMCGSQEEAPSLEGLGERQSSPQQELWEFQGSAERSNAENLHP